LSSGLVSAVEPPLVSRSAEVSVFIPRQWLVLEQTSLGVTGLEQATPTGLTRITSIDASSFASVDTPASLNARETTLRPSGPLEGETGAPPFPLSPGWVTTIGPAVWRASIPTSDNVENDADMSNVGPLELFELEDGFSTWTAALSATGRATPHGLSFVVTDPSLQVDEMSEVPNTSGLSYLATGGGGTLDSPRLSGDGALSWDDGLNEPISPTSITVGGASLNVLLSADQGLIETEPGSLEQFAELVPLPESSLALAATLWTVPSDSSTDSGPSDAPAGKPIDPDARNALASSWVLFVTGMDEALEQASRDIRDRDISRDARQAAHERPAGASDARHRSRTTRSAGATDRTASATARAADTLH
jgi:hypothetical protein